MGRHKENLSGGLVDGPDPAQLEPGQLSGVQNAHYVPSSPALQRATGRSGFATATGAGGGATHVAASVNGLRDSDFDWNAGHYLIAQVSGSVPAYVTSFVGDTGAFAVLSTAMTAGNSLEVVQHNNRFFLMNGVSASASGSNSNAVIYLSSTAASSTLQIRQHGMMPVVSPPTTATAASSFALSVTGYYEYWATEVAKFTQDGVQVELESTFGGNTSTASTGAGASPVTVFISSTAQAPVLKMPPTTNSITTHWRVYRSPKKEFSNDHEFPVGFAIGTISTASALIVDAIDAGSSIQALPTTENTTGPYANFASASSMRTDNGVYASATGIPVGGPWGSPTWQQQGVYGFAFGGFKGFVQGIEVEIKAYTTSTTGAAGFPVMVGLMKRGPGGGYGGGPYGWRTGIITGQSPGQVLTIGSSADRWVNANEVGFADTDFDTNLMAVIQIPQGHLGVDYVKVKPYYGVGSNQDSIVPFPTVVYNFGDISAQVGKNGPPPSSRTGDIYEDCLVLNDELNPSLIRWSAPGLPEYFPGTYFIDFETRDNDVVQCIKVVNNRLVVLLDNSSWRVNYLPSERDASFDRGKAIEPITRTFGCINPMVACVFSLDSSTEILAWVSQKGIHTTDGYSFDTLTNGIDWRSVLSLTSTSEAIALVNDPENKELRFLYRNDALTENYKTLNLSYAERHGDRDNLKISGKINMRNYEAVTTSAANPRSMWTVPRRSGDTSVYVGYASATAAGGGLVYRETGTAIPAQDPNMAWVSRRMFLAGEGSEARVNEVYGYIGSNSSTAGIDMKLLTIKTNDDTGEVAGTNKTISFGGRKLGKWQFRQISEGVRLSAVVTGTPNQSVSWDYVLIDGEGFGEEDSGL